MKTLHPKIQELKQRAAPIAYSSVSVDASGNLQDRENLLDQRIVQGYGCIWRQVNSFNERFHKGAFAKSIRDNGPGSGAAYEIKFRDEHGRAMSLFETLIEDDIGLFFRTKPLDTVQWADDCLVQLKSRTINNFSDGFMYIFENNAMKYDDTTDILDIFQARLFEISATAIPSDMATFAVRSAEDLEDLYEETETFIASLPKQNRLEARKMIARHKALDNIQPLEQRNKALAEIKPPIEQGLDYNYLINNFKL